MDYERVASIGDVPENGMIPVEAGGRKLLLARADGEFFAAQRKCPHLGFNLCRGRIEQRSVVCPLHKAKFSLETGEIERDPRLLFLNLTAKSDLATYPVRVEGGEVLIGVQR